MAGLFLKKGLFAIGESLQEISDVNNVSDFDFTAVKTHVTLLTGAH